MHVLLGRTRRKTYSFPSDIRKRRRDNHNNHKAEQPVASTGNRIRLSATPERRDLRAVQEGPTDPCETEESVEEEEEARSHELVRAIRGRAQAGDDGEADAHAGGSDHEGSAATQAFDEEN